VFRPVAIGLEIVIGSIERLDVVLPAPLASQSDGPSESETILFVAGCLSRERNYPRPAAAASRRSLPPGPLDLCSLSRFARGAVAWFWALSRGLAFENPVVNLLRVGTSNVRKMRWFLPPYLGKKSPR
jgi:hypothetical protein